MPFDFYKNKRSELKEALAISESYTLCQELEKAIKLTDFSIIKCKELRDVSQRNLDFYLANKNYSQNKEIITNNMWEIFRAEYKIPHTTDIDKRFKNQFDKDLVRIQSKIQDISLDSGELDTNKLISFLKNNFTELLLTVHISGLYEYIFKPNASKFDHRTILDFFVYMAGLIPVIGPFVSGISTIDQIINRRKNELTSADRYLIYLHEYTQSLKYWCGISGEIIANFETVHRDSVNAYIRLTSGLSRTH